MNRTAVAESHDDGNGDVAGRVVEAVADHRGVDAAALSEPLYDAVDPEALDALVAHEGFWGTVVFRYAGCQVTVGGDGSVDVAQVQS